MADDEPGDRQFEPAIKADPLGWMTTQIEQVEKIVAAKVPDLTAYRHDLAEIRRQAPLIVGSIEQMMEQVHRMELAEGPG
jgi:hypothetical protein